MARHVKNILKNLLCRACLQHVQHKKKTHTMSNNELQILSFMKERESNDLHQLFADCGVLKVIL